jgi:hypothetical protein
MSNSFEFDPGLDLLFEENEGLEMPLQTMRDDVIIDAPDIEQAIIDEIKEQSRQRGEVIVLGAIHDLAPSAQFKGKNSVAKRLAAGEIAQDQLDKAISIIGDFYVPITPMAPERCVEDRPGTERDTDMEIGRALGPQYPSGSAGYTIPYRLAIGEIDVARENNTSELDDLRTTNEITFRAGQTPGGHDDVPNHGKKDGSTGCGSQDTKKAQLEDYLPENVQGTQELTQAVLGDSFNQEDFDEVAANGAELLDYKDYFSDNHEILDELRRVNPGGVETAVGKHKACILAINTVEGDTFLRETFADQFDDDIMAHNLDVPENYKKAREASDNPQIQSRFVHAAIARAAQVTLQLFDADGSVVVVLRKPRG